MSTDNNRTDQSPSDPQYGWHGVNTDIRNRPAPLTLDEMRRCVPGQNQTAVAKQGSEIAAFSYNAGIPEQVAARIINLEGRVAELEMLIDKLLKS